MTSHVTYLPRCSDGCPAGPRELLGWPLVVYAVWAVPYYLFLFVLPCSRDWIAREKKVTLFNYLMSVPAKSAFIRLFPEKGLCGQ